MKKVLAMVLVLALCLALGACGSSSEEDVVGTYAYASGIYSGAIGEGDTLSLHDDFTYDWGYERGTYKVSGNKIVLTNSHGNRVTTLIKQGDFCYSENLEPIVDDYGRTITFSKEGRIEHWFRWSKLESNNVFDSYDLTLYENGSFYLLTALDRNSVDYSLSKIEGNYSLENNILTLTSEDVTYYLVCTNEGITKYVFKKQSSETVKRGDIVERPVEAPVE